MQQDHIKEKLLKLPKISQIVGSAAKSAKKSLGQNFLVDETIARQIINSVFIKDLPVLEIGPGCGALTREIMYKSNGLIEIHVVEKDQSMAPYLEELQSIDHMLKIHYGDAVTFREDKLADKIQIIANLPYNIGTKLLLKWVKTPTLFASITVMLQKEVVKRLYAEPNTSDYGSLSVFVQVLCDVEHVLDVPADSFLPHPKVESAVIRLVPRSELEAGLDLGKLESILKACFANKRKMIRHALNTIFGNNMSDVVKKCKVDETARPEELSVQDYINLSKKL